MKIRTRILAGIMSLTMVAMLAACGGGTSITPDTAAGTNEGETLADDGGADETPVPEGNIELRFSWWGGDTRHDATLAAIDRFMELYPHITVRAEYGAWDGWTEKCATQLSGGTAPDLMQVNWNWLYQFSSDGSRFADLNELSDIITLSNYPANVLEEGVVAGKQQGLPVGVTGKVFYWNATTFEAAGIPIPTTFDELVAAGATFQSELGDDYYPIAMYEYERLLLMMYYLQSKYNKDWAVDNALNYSVEEITEGFEWLMMLEDEHVLPSIATLRGDGATVLEKNPKWSTGHYAGFYEWDSAQQKFDDALEEGQEFVMGEFLKGDNDAGLTKVNMCFAITETSEHKEEAALLLEFLTSDPEGVSIVGTERGMVANTAAQAVLEAEGTLAGLTYDGNKAVMEVAAFSLDPNFENSALKDDTGIYYEVLESLSHRVSSAADLAQYFYDEVNAVYAANAY